MKVSIAFTLCLIALSGCQKSTSADAINENLRLLNQKITEQEKFIVEAKKVLAEHRTHLMAVEGELAKLTGKSKAHGKTKK